MAQAVIVFLFALVLGVPLILTITTMFWVVVIVMLGAGFFTGLSMIIASIVKTRERFMGIGQVITLPLFFASSAIYPISIMPAWLQAVAYLNPLSYMVDGLRELLVTGSLVHLPSDVAILAGVALVISVVSAYMYPKVVV